MGAGFWRGPARPRPPERGATRLGRFQRSRRLGEEYAARWVQAITLALLCGALIWLLASSFRLLRAHFLADYGQRAWLLPLGIGIILLVLLYRLFRFAGELRELRRALERSRNALNDK
jgi:hypothetical protein